MTTLDKLFLLEFVLWSLMIFLIGVYLSPLVYLLVTGDYPGAGIFYGLQEDHWLVTWLLSIR